MEEVVQAAQAAYENFPETDKKKIKEKFDSLDEDGGGQISLVEFMKHYTEYKKDPEEKRKISSFVDQNDENGDVSA